MFDGDAFFGLDGLVEAFVVTATLHKTTGVFVDDDDFAGVGHNVIFVTLEESFGAEGLLHVINEVGVFGGVKFVDAKCFLDFFDTFVGEGDGAAFFVNDVIFRSEGAGDTSEGVVSVGVVPGGGGDDERGAGFVD